MKRPLGLSAGVVLCAALAACRADAAPKPDPGTLDGYRDKVGRTFLFEVTGKKDGVVYGTGVYTDDSVLATAAVHSGHLKPGQKGVIRVTILKGETSYAASTRHGVTTLSYGEWPGAYRIEPEPKPDPGTLDGYRDKAGQAFLFHVTGKTDGVIYGTGIYTDDSNLATAAVHAGILKDGQKGLVRVTILKGEKSYAASTSNGITSTAYGEWPGAYSIEAITE
jgi:hypothetical protein